MITEDATVSKNEFENAELTETILGSCFEVMNYLGAGFLETVYKNGLIVSLQEKGIKVSQEVEYEIQFKGKKIGYYRADVLVDDRVIVELKCCKCLLPEHKAQLINYLKASKISTGLLINFGRHQLEYNRLFG